MAHWTELPCLALDTETTSKYPFEARIVEIGTVLVHADGSTSDQWRQLVDPGCEIPDEAAAIHGISTEQARDEGCDPAWALMQLAERVIDHVRDHEAQAGIVIFNAPYDLPLIIAECGRNGIDWPCFAGILDPLTIDRVCDYWRRDAIHHRPVAHTHEGGFEQARAHRNGNRKLIRLADLYGVELGDAAHGAVADATASGQILWKQVERFPKLADNTLASLWVKQVLGAEKERDKLQDWVRRERDPLAEVSGGWPLPTRVETDPTKPRAPRVATPKTSAGQQPGHRTANVSDADPVLAQAGDPAEVLAAGSPADFVPMSETQNRRVHALISKARPGQDRHTVMAEILGRPITTARQLSDVDADRIVDVLDIEARTAS